MGSAVGMRADYSSDPLRRLPKSSRDRKQSRRLLSLAAVLDSMSREDAARVGGLDRQTLRDWVHRFNDAGPDGLKDAWNGGPLGPPIEILFPSLKWRIVPAYRSALAECKVLISYTADASLLADTERPYEGEWARKDWHLRALDAVEGRALLKSIGTGPSLLLQPLLWI